MTSSLPAGRGDELRRSMARHRPRTFFLSNLFVIAMLLVTLPASPEERPGELGFPVIHIFEQRTHRGGAQSFDIAQDARGILYIANLGGVLTYDGAAWQMIALPNDASADEIETDLPRGRVALGSVGDFGILESDSRGSTRYRSLASLLPPAAREFGAVRSIAAAAKGFHFLTDHFLFAWDGGSPRVVAEFKDPAKAPRRVYRTEGHSWLVSDDGLREVLASGELRVTALAGQKVRLVMGTARPDTVLVAVDNTGLFLVQGSTATPFSPEASAWIQGKRITGGRRVPDGRYVITTRDHGLILLAADGSVDEVIDEASGLPRFILMEPFIDRDSALWLAYDGPIVRIDLASPVSLLDSRRGVKGSVSAVAHYGGKLYAATSRGLFVVESDARAPATHVEGLPLAAWSLLPYGDELLVGTVEGLFTIRGGAAPQLLETTKKLSISALARSTAYAGRVWLGTTEGLASMHREPGGWVYDGVIAGTHPYVSTIAEQKGVVWCGTIYHGVVRVESPFAVAPSVRTFGDGEEISVFSFQDRAVVIRPSNRIDTVGSSGTLVPDPVLGRIRTPKPFFLLATNRSGDVWLNSVPPRVFRRGKDGSYPAEGAPLPQVHASDIQSLTVDDEQVVWFGGDDGLYRYSPPRTAASMPQPAPMIRRVIAGADEILYGGGVRKGAPPTHLPYGVKRLRFEFAPLTFSEGTLYQYRLDPDEDWSAWSDEPFVDFTNLREGRYSLRLRTKGPESVSSEVVWAFSVAPPWFRTPLAIILWTLAGIALLAAMIWWRTRSLSQVAVTLRERVNTQTRELQDGLERLRSAQHELVEKNTLLEQLSLVDDLTGIANRRALHRALSTEWNRAIRRGESVALILLDLDHFKDLNDRLGHGAGDACLRSVGAFLASSVRRAGDVVCRYGGEEFAVLLPSTDRTEAVRIAETLRLGIQGLGGVADGGQRWSVTASGGVAALVPTPEVSTDSLIEAADRALYAAKRSGRNRVEESEESPLQDLG